MKGSLFCGLRNRTTEGGRPGKPRNTKENRHMEGFSTVSKLHVVHHSSQRDNQKRISKCLQTLETPYVSGVFHFSGNIVECRETG